jgi:hypothetical protein
MAWCPPPHEATLGAASKRWFCENHVLTSHQIVQAASAGFFDEHAEKVLGTDHHTICNSATSQRGYPIVEDMLCKIRSALAVRVHANNPGTCQRRP